MTGLSLRSSGQPRKPLRAKSKKRARQEVTYRRTSREYLAENPWCARCGAQATEVHHMRGRGTDYLNVDLWLGLCSPCHRYLTLNPRAAIAAGFSLLRNGVRVIK